MADINVSSPGDTDVVSNFPADERASRAALLALLNGAATWGGTSGGTAQAQTVTISNTGVTLTAGMTIDFIAGNANTDAAPTLTVNSLTAKTIVTGANGALVAGDIASGQLHTVRYDGTSFRLINPAVTGVITQAAYDKLFPLGYIQIRWDDQTPVVPSGITATWLLISDTDRYIRFNAGAGGGSGGSSVTGSDGGEVLTTGAPSSIASDVDRSGSGDVASQSHTHSVTTSDHTHSCLPKYRDVRGFRRTA